MSLLCVGYEPTTVPGVESLIAPVTPPSNYKDPVKIANYVESARGRQLNEAGKKPLTSKLLRISFVTDGQAMSPPSGSILDMLRAFEYIAVIEAQLFKSLIIADQIDRFGGLGQNQWIVTSMRSGVSYLVPRDTLQVEKTPVVFDPIHAIVGSSAEECTIPELVSERFGLRTTGDTIADRRAWLAFDICQKLGVS